MTDNPLLPQAGGGEGQDGTGERPALPFCVSAPRSWVPPGSIVTQASKDGEGWGAEGLAVEGPAGARAGRQELCHAGPTSASPTIVISGVTIMLSTQ